MLKKFRDMLAQGSGDAALKAPPFVIKASDLDRNFSLCYPIPQEGNNVPYIIERQGNDGYKLRGAKTFDVCENGQPAKYLFFAQRLPNS